MNVIIPAVDAVTVVKLMRMRRCSQIDLAFDQSGLMNQDLEMNELQGWYNVVCSIRCLALHFPVQKNQ